jgi:metallo-beta-lactamase class B
MAAPTVALIVACFCGAVLAARPQQQPSDPPVWTAPQQPFRIFGNVHYVGTRGLSAILLTSSAGHILLDGAITSSAAMVMDNIRAAGFKVEDIRLIVNSHPHYDHAGGIAAIQRASGARVAALAASARVLERGSSGTDDPQYGVVPPMEPVPRVDVVRDGETLHVGPLAVTARATGGHTPGSTSWTWRSCEADRCLDFVYADSLTAVSAEGFLFTRSKEYPTVIAEFEKTFATLSTVPCDVLLTPHPEASDLWGRLAKRGQGAVPDPLVDSTACRRYAENGRNGLTRRITRENTTGR